MPSSTARPPAWKQKKSTAVLKFGTWLPRGDSDTNDDVSVGRSIVGQAKHAVCIAKKQTDQTAAVLAPSCCAPSDALATVESLQEDGPHDLRLLGQGQDERSELSEVNPHCVAGYFDNLLAQADAAESQRSV